jgi:rhamnosyltransferase
MNKSDVCLVYVTYHPDAQFPVRLKSVASQVDSLIIVDNGSTDDALHMLNEIAANPAIRLALNSENLGIAAALNIGIQQAVILGYRWVLLLDQDSRVHADLVDALLEVHESFLDKNRLAVLGSGYAPHGSSEPTDHVAPGNQGHSQAAAPLWDEVECAITSGSLLSLDAYSLIGPFREEFFIDHVDYEYCVRARASGYRVIQTRRSLMSHSIGAPTQHKVLWFKKWTTNHSADRRYYFARNDTVMLRESGNYKWGLWAIKGLMRSFRTCKRIVLYEREKVRKSVAVIHGWWDGVRGNMGPRRAYTPGTIRTSRTTPPSSTARAAR